MHWEGYMTPKVSFPKRIIASSLWKNTKQTQIEQHSTKYLIRLFKNIQVMEDKESHAHIGYFEGTLNRGNLRCWQSVGE